MILGQISYLDCLVFVLLLIPQLLIHAPKLDLLRCIATTLPFLTFQLPYQTIKDRYFVPHHLKPPFIQNASPFQHVVINCVRHAFAKIPASIGSIFFSKPVAFPFLRFRMLRHGFLRSSIPWKEVVLGRTKDGFLVHGLHIGGVTGTKPDLVILHCHGGGFSMGSAYFYLEFLLAWLSLLRSRGGYKNAVIFSLEYTLVPHASYPTQVDQALIAYDYVSSLVGDSSRIVFSGDSAGGTLILSLLLQLSHTKCPTLDKAITGNGTKSNYDKPGFAALISPWTTLYSKQNRNTASDFLDHNSLHEYGQKYAGNGSAGGIDPLNDPIASPGMCKSSSRWQHAAPTAGFGVLYGSEEIMGPEIRLWLSLLQRSGVDVDAREERGGVHAWPVVSLFLSDGQEARQRGLIHLIDMIVRAVPPAT